MNRKYFFAWFGMVVIAIANGTLRQWGYLPLVGELAAHQISSATLILFFFLYFWIVSGKWPLRSPREAWSVGLFWFGMTIAFEFGFGHFVFGNPWSKLLHDYDITEGRLWSLVLLAILVGPYCLFRIRRSSAIPSPPPSRI